jgi:pSer/pThr/pTyr-binding forkhead associated (FHA) protein
VSRHHFTIKRQAGDEYTIMDLGSSNGTFVYDPKTLETSEIMTKVPFKL